ncbi:MAG TPA: ribonuclease HI family protein [Candidatus Baltobacteraceae bacterium]|nr:ribonuclease HI family protein [Candidatus Baltobacteraceae bacterium]
MPSHKHLITYTDGGSRGNPGPSAFGYVVKTPDGETIAGHGEYIGVTTNNQAEYKGILAAIRKARELGAETLEMRMDSELAVKQLTGEYKVKDAGLATLYLLIHNEKIALKKVTFKHVRREYNTEADAQVNKALDRHLKK